MKLHPLRLVFAGFLASMLSLSPLSAQQPSDNFQPEAQMPMPDRVGAVAVGKKWLVATANNVATEAGVKVLRAGGNAIDAMVAIQTTLGLTEPQSSGLGGGAFLVYWDAKNKHLTTFDGRETAPMSITPELFLDQEGKALNFFDAVVSGLSVGVPGVPKLLHEVHKRFGVKPWPELIAPAIDLAEKGIVVSPRLSGLIADRQDGLRRFATTRDYFFDNQGAPVASGTILKNPAYAATLRAFQAQGADAIYRGPIAEAIVAAVQGAETFEGTLTLADLENYRLKEREPVCAPYRGYDVCGMGPPSSGAVAIGQILGMLERFDIPALGPKNPIAWQLFADANRLAFADRGRYLADQDFLAVPLKGLLDHGYLKQRSELIQEGKKLETATPGTPNYDHALNYSDDRSIEIPSTSHFVIRDTEGNIVSMTTTIESAFGSNLMVAGFLLNNQLTDFSFETHANGLPIANAAAPGKRPRSSMAPTIIFKDGEPMAALGSPGGSRIISYVSKTIIALLDWGVSIQAAIDLPNMTNRFGTYALEANTDAVEMQQSLEALGYETVIIPLNSGVQGFSIKDGIIQGAADHRREGTVIAE